MNQFLRKLWDRIRGIEIVSAAPEVDAGFIEEARFYKMHAQSRRRNDPAQTFHNAFEIVPGPKQTVVRYTEQVIPS